MQLLHIFNIMKFNHNVNPKKVKLSEVRTKLNMKQEDMAEFLDISRSYLSKFENNKVSIEWIEKAVKLQKLLQEAGFSLEDLVLPVEEK